MQRAAILTAARFDVEKSLKFSLADIYLMKFIIHSSVDSFENSLQAQNAERNLFVRQICISNKFMDILGGSHLMMANHIKQPPLPTPLRVIGR